MAAVTALLPPALGVRVMVGLVCRSPPQKGDGFNHGAGLGVCVCEGG